MTQKHDGGWQPIETAPKDDMIIVYCPPEDAKFEFFEGEGAEMVDDPKPAFIGCAQWFEYDCGFGVFGIHWLGDTSQPTHWMPLPAPPAARSGGET